MGSRHAAPAEDNVPRFLRFNLEQARFDAVTKRRDFETSPERPCC